MAAQHRSDDEFVLVSETGSFMLGCVSWREPLLQFLLPI